MKLEPPRTRFEIDCTWSLRERHKNLLPQEAPMKDKYIGFDIDSKKTVACVIQQGRKDLYATFPTDLTRMLHLRLSMTMPG